MGMERNEVVWEVAVRRACRYSWALRAAARELSGADLSATGGDVTAAIETQLFYTQGE